MRRARIARVAVAALAAAALLVTVLAGPASAKVVRFAFMDGAQEVPPADPDGTGVARIEINSGTGTVCWTIDVSNIELPATAAHIHRGAAGVNGPVEVTLSPPDGTGHAEGCTTASKALLKEIKKNSSAFYVNVHNEPFPGGAVRGQLQPAP